MYLMWDGDTYFDEVYRNIPPDIYRWAREKFDGGHLVSFLKEYKTKDLYTTLEDFINGFTLAVMYINREQFTQEDRKWVRISVSIIFGEALGFSLTSSDE